MNKYFWSGFFLTLFTCLTLLSAPLLAENNTEKKIQAKKIGLLFENNKRLDGCIIKHIFPFSPAWKNHLFGQIKTGDQIVNVIDTSNKKTSIPCQEIINKIKTLLADKTTTQIKLSLLENNKPVEIELQSQQEFILTGFINNHKTAPINNKETSILYGSYNKITAEVSTNKQIKEKLKTLDKSFQNLADNLFVPRLSLIELIQNQPDKSK